MEIPDLENIKPSKLLEVMIRYVEQFHNRRVYSGDFRKIIKKIISKAESITTKTKGFKEALKKLKNIPGLD